MLPGRLPKRNVQLSAGRARALALRASGMPANARPAVTRRGLHALALRLGLFQIDSVNVVARAQYMPAFSRLGPYDRTAFEDLAYGRRRRLFEYWGHEASLIPLEYFPLFRWRMERARRGDGLYPSLARFAREHRALVRDVLRRIESDGPLAASQFDGAKGQGSWWGWSDVKRALEYLFWTGDITTATRRKSFERVYDLTQRVVPERYYRADVSEREAHRELLRIALRAMGVATETDLRDYFRLAPADSRAALTALVESGDAIACDVRGWKHPAYLDPGATASRRLETSAILSPFDPIVWNRPRALRLFDFEYRIEIYTPAHKRVHGYYVLPYLLGDSLVGRLDVKADRLQGTLRVHAVHYEKGVSRGVVRERLDEDLKTMAGWLELQRVEMPRRS